MYLYFVQLCQEQQISVHCICTVRVQQQPTLFLTDCDRFLLCDKSGVLSALLIMNVKEHPYTFLPPFHTLMLIAGSRNLAMWLNAIEEVDCNLGNMDVDITDFKLGFSK